MTRITLLIIATLLFSGCRKHIAEKDLSALNGYWEIQQATKPDGNVQTYENNTVIDYIQMDSKRKGFRKKIQLDLLGNMETSDDAEPFEIQIVDGQWVFIYSNDGNQWSEILTKLNTETFTVRNREGFEYQYRSLGDNPLGIGDRQ